MKCKVALLKPTPIDYLELFLGMFKVSKKKKSINEDFVNIYIYIYLFIYFNFIIFPESLAYPIFQHGIFKIKLLFDAEMLNLP
jgi:hypothetical protein